MKKRYWVLLLVFLLGMIASLIVLILWNQENHQTKTIVSKEEMHLVQQEDVTYLDPAILEDNPDTVGWIIVEGTNINYPVVQGKDNDYYLNHDFNKEENSAGWIFMDYRNQPTDQNLILYGHHRKDGSMFGSVDLLFDSSFYKENHQILWITEKEMVTYTIFSVYRANQRDAYTQTTFSDFSKQIISFQNKSEIVVEKNNPESSQIITLSTCHDNNVDRLVIHGYKNN